MGTKMYKDKIDVFYGGIADDPRIQKPEVFQIAQHFDIWTYPKQLVPYRAMEDDTTDSTYRIVLFEYLNSILFGFGIVPASAKVKIYQKATDNITGSWTASTSGEDSAGTRFAKCFRAFHNYLYGGSSGTRIWAYGDVTSSPSFTQTAYSGAGEPVCQGIVTTDDFLIIPCSGGIAKKSGAGSGPTDTWSVFNLIPSGYTVTDLCESGDFVIFLGKPTSGVGNSKGFIWDKRSTDLTDVIDFGHGAGLILDEIEGEVICISNVNGGTAYSIKSKMVVRAWAGGNKSRVLFEIEGDVGTSSLSIYGSHCKFKDGNRLIFGVLLIIDGTTYNQFFAIGRKTANYPLAFTFDRLVNNDTALTNTIDGCFKLGDYVFVAFNADGSIKRTNDQAVFTNATPIYITQKLTGEAQAGEDARRKRKTLNMAGLLFKSLGDGKTISLYYRVDATTTWTLIRTVTGDDAVLSMGFEAGIENDGSDFKNYKELQFKVQCTGGAVPTAVIYSFNVEDADIQSE